MSRITLLTACFIAAWLAPGLVTHSLADTPAPPAARPARPPAVGSANAKAAASSTRTPVGTGAVTVDLLNVDSSDGQVLAALFRSARNFPGGGDKAFGKVVQKARAGVVRLDFANIPAGPFAVTVHHDEDGDFEFDTGLFGIPTEGYGFSRNAHAPFGPPDFEDCRLVMKPGQRHHLKIKLRY